MKFVHFKRKIMKQVAWRECPNAVESKCSIGAPTADKRKGGLSSNRTMVFQVHWIYAVKQHARKKNMVQLSCKNNGPFLNHKKGCIFQHLHPRNLYNIEIAFSKPAFFGNLFVKFPGCTIPETNIIILWKSMVGRWFISFSGLPFSGASCCI